MNNLADSIISVFLEKQAYVLKDTELSTILVSQGIPCISNDIRRYVQLLSPVLFQTTLNPDGSITIRLDPKLEICEDFLSSRCKAEAKTCDKLHICRHFEGDCPTPNCRFAHNFDQGYNHQIIMKNRCQHINPLSLVKLLRLSKSSSIHGPSRKPRGRGPRGGKERNRGGRGRGGGRGRSFTHQASTRNKNDPHRQIDVSFPSSNLAQQMDMEMIELILQRDGIEIEEKLDKHENEYFRRQTIQLRRTTDIDKLLETPIINYHGIAIKFKRTNHTIDKKSFLLKTTIANENEKITESRFALYISTLVGKGVQSRAEDLSSETEQIILVQCDIDLDLTQVRQAHESRPQLYGKQIALVQIYECDTLETHYNEENKSITNADLQAIFRSVWDNIFSYNFPTDDYAEVEFISANAFKQWMSTNEFTKNKFDITISPIIDNVDENATARPVIEPPSLMNTNTRPTTTHVFSDRTRQTIIKLHPEWALIAAHSKFQLEYKAFIRSEFGGELTINEDESIYCGSFPPRVQGSNNEVILGNKTHDFMKQFKCQTLFSLTQDQIDILREKSTDLAYKRVKEHDYLVAAKFKDMAELKRIIFHRDKLRPSTEQLQPLMKRHSIQNTVSRSSSTMSLNSDISETSRSLSQRSSIGSNSSMYTIYSPDHIIMFSIERFEDRLRQHLNDTYHVKLNFERKNFNEKTKGAKSCISIKITGDANETQNATDELIDLFSLKQTKKFDEQTDGTWTNVIDAIDVIQYHFKLADLTCICEQISPGTVFVHYFHISNPQFGIDEQQIDDIVRDKFQSALVSFTPQTSDSIVNKERTHLQEILLKRDDYNKNICFATQPDMIYLFGLPELVKEYREKFEQLKSKYEPQSCKFILTDKQFNYLKAVAKGDLNKLEKRYKSNGCDISLARLRQYGEFLAPPDLHSKIKESLDELTTIEDISFEVTDHGFDILASKEPDRLLHIVKPKCYLEKSIETRREYIPIPTAHIADLDDGMNSKPTTASNASSRVTSVIIDHSTVAISIGDLTTQAVDAIVVCSSSQYLCKTIVEKAGPVVVKEYIALRSSEEFPSTITAGELSCKKIFFIPWSANSNDDDDIKTSLSTFIATAFLFANSDGYKSIAFPAVGCGGFNFAPLTIAKYMLQEIRKQLKAAKQKMNISFVLLANQQDIYDAFIQRLNELVTIDINVNQKSPSKPKQDQSTILYDRKIVKITLISSTKDHLMKCKQEIINLAHSFPVSTKLTNKRDMLDWRQKTIYTYYEFCLKQHVIPTLDLDNVTLELVGTKDAVHEAEKYFYELTNETLKQERIHAMSRGVIWSVELIPNSDTWEQYSFKLNGIIEDAYLKQHTQIQFSNDKDENCRIVFATMLEHGSQIRRVRRKPINSILPSTWDPSDHNCKRVTLSSASSEYQNVLAQFHVTMLGKYSQIIKIERIQNERWFKQYDAHREDFKRRYGKLDERQLFHGCTGTATSQIIENCFNRSFAGVNGNLFGFGVYFHAQASYSHNYAYASSTGERTMFLASVLIGKTCKGDKDMKTAPTGYDTTTDGQHIFVVYHDAGVYADYLLTYK